MLDQPGCPASKGRKSFVMTERFVIVQTVQGWTRTNAFHVCITSYKLVIQDHHAFRRKKWKYFILDEVRRMIGLLSTSSVVCTLRSSL